MKKLLATSAILAALTTVAFADTTPATNHPAPADAQASDSLLSTLLANASALSASLSNVAENLNSVDGSINITTSRNFDGLATGIASLAGGTGAGEVPFGSYSSAGANVIARDIPAVSTNVLNPLTLTVGDLSTTAIGAMQSGSMTGSVNASGIVDRVTTAATASTTSANSSAENYGGVGGALAFQNVASNLGDVNGSVQLSLADVNSNLGKIGTTAIGAMGSGSLTATITGNLAPVKASTSGIINALVGVAPVAP